MSYQGTSDLRQADPTDDTIVCVVRALVALGRHAELPDAEIRSRVLRELNDGLVADALDPAQLDAIAGEWERAVDQVLGRGQGDPGEGLPRQGR